jgi:hypothetical protein
VESGAGRRVRGHRFSVHTSVPGRETAEFVFAFTVGVTLAGPTIGADRKADALWYAESETRAENRFHVEHAVACALVRERVCLSEFDEAARDGPDGRTRWRT